MVEERFLNETYVKIKRREIKYGITHNGVFHADDVLCSALLKKINPNIKIIRTNDVFPYLERKDYIIFDIGMGKYDHHQPLEEKAKRPDGTPYCALGLLWKEIGKSYLLDILYNSHSYISKIWEYIDTNYIYKYDYTDNNGLYALDFEDAYLIKKANPNFLENGTDPSFFETALTIGDILLEKYILTSWALYAYGEIPNFHKKQIKEYNIILENYKKTQSQREKELNDNLATIKINFENELKSNDFLSGTQTTLNEINSISQNLPYFTLNKFYPISRLFRFKTAPISEKNGFKPVIEPKCFIISPSIRDEGFQINKIYDYTLEDVVNYLPDEIQKDITFIHSSGMTATSKTIKSAIVLANTAIILKTSPKIYQMFLEKYTKKTNEKEKYNLSFLENALLDISLSNPEIFDKILVQNDKDYFKEAFDKIQKYNVLFNKNVIK